nr:aminotransferase class V-fold PLP-dependent enzyme [Actinomadura rupiterrae]
MPQPPAPQPPAPQPRAPQSHVPEPDAHASQTHVSPLPVSQLQVPQPPVPEPRALQSHVPEPDVLDAHASQTHASQTHVSAPPVSQSQVPHPPAPQPRAPQSHVPEPDVLDAHASQTHVSPLPVSRPPAVESRAPELHVSQPAAPRPPANLHPEREAAAPHPLAAQSGPGTSGPGAPSLDASGPGPSGPDTFGPGASGPGVSGVGVAGRGSSGAGSSGLGAGPLGVSGPEVLGPGALGQGRGEIVVPATAHPAFRKAAHYLGVDVVTVPVDPETFRADPDAVRDAITPRTILVVCSAPSYPQGVMDPVEEIAAIAADAGVLCHVDACVGGWVLPWLREQGRDVPPFDLSVPGVTSLSCDLHKYGYAPKGASVVLFADEALRRRAYYASAEWPGYTVINATVQSSRSAGPLAAAWATLRTLGADGYRELAASAMAAADRLREGVAAIPGLRVLGDPAVPLVAVTSDDPALDVFVLADEARARGWFFQPQLGYQGIPANLHFTLTGVTDVEALLAALAEAAEAAREAGPPDVPSDLVDALQALDLDAMTDAEFAGLLQAVGVELDGPGEPEMAFVNTVLNALPPATREALLIRFLSVLYSDAL